MEVELNHELDWLLANAAGTPPIIVPNALNPAISKRVQKCLSVSCRKPLLIKVIRIVEHICALFNYSNNCLLYIVDVINSYGIIWISKMLWIKVILVVKYYDSLLLILFICMHFNLQNNTMHAGC